MKQKLTKQGKTDKSTILETSTSFSIIDKPRRQKTKQKYVDDLNNKSNKFDLIDTQH